MEYFVEITPQERNILANLLGKPIDSIQDLSGAHTVGFCVRLNILGSTIDFTPDEIATPEANKPYADVTRPLITNDQSALRPDLKWTTILENAGTVDRIAILHTLVTFSPLLSPSNPNVTTMIYGTGEAWGNIFLHPTKSAVDNLKVSDRYAVVYLDIGVTIFTNTGLAITIMTDGTSYYVKSHIADKISDGLETYVALESI